jgi:hypothetical protein
MPFQLRLAIGLAGFLTAINALVVFVAVSRILSGNPVSMAKVLFPIATAGLFGLAAIALHKRQRIALLFCLSAITVGSVPLFRGGTVREALAAEILHAVFLVATLLSWTHLSGEAASV